MIRLALYGPRGAGKSTVSSIMCDLLGQRLVVLHSAAPLYELQDYVYTFAGLQPPMGRQDGETLGAMAKVLRRIRPDFLTAKVAAQANLAEAAGASVFLCDDSVPADRANLAEAGFRFVHVDAPHNLRLLRRVERNDVSALYDSNDPDVPHLHREDVSIVNDGSLSDLRGRVARLAIELRL